MRLKFTYGRQELFSHYSEKDEVTVRQILQSVKDSHPDIYKRLCDKEGRLRDSLLVFINGDHIRYHNGMDTDLNDGDELYVIPLMTGG